MYEVQKRIHIQIPVGIYTGTIHPQFRENYNFFGVSHIRSIPNIKGTPVYRNTGISKDKLCIDNSKDGSKTKFVQ